MSYSNNKLDGLMFFLFLMPNKKKKHYEKKHYHVKQLNNDIQ